MANLRAFLLLGVGSFWAGTWTPALSQTQSGTPPQPAAGEPSGGIGDIVVTARKRSESLQNVPVAITAFTPEALQQKQIVNIADMTQHTSGVTLQLSSTTQQFEVTVRGQNTLDSTLNLDPAVGIYVDGVYIGPDIGNAVALNFDDAASVEVLKGPQGTLYGRNTSGGAIKLDHVIPDYKVSGWVTGELGNYDLHTIKGAVTLPLATDFAALRLYGKYTKRDGFGRNPIQGVDVNDDKAYSFGGTLRLDPTPELRIVLRANYDKSKSGGPSIRPVAILPTTNLATIAIALTQGYQNAFQADGTLTPNAISRAQTDFFGLGPKGFYDMTSRFPTPNNLELYNGSATITYELSNNLSIKSITGYRHIDTYRGIDFSGGFAASIIAVQEPLTYKQFTEELNLNGSGFDDRLKYTLGAFYLHASGRDIANPVTAPILGQVFGAASPVPAGIGVQDGSQKTRSYAVYGQATYEIAPGLNLTGGLRYTKEHKDLTSRNQFRAGTYNPNNGFVDTLPPVLNVTLFCSEPTQGIGDDCVGFQPYTFSKVTWLGSADYKITPDILVYAKASRGFRSGGGQLRLGGFGFPPFGPETVDDYEIGIKADLFDRLARVNIAVYQDEYSGLQKTFLQVVNGALNSVVQNAGRARIRGVEFDALVEPVRGLTFGFSGAYTDPKYLTYRDPATGADLSQQDFQNVAKFVYTLTADYKIPTSWGEINANLSYWHTSDVPLQPGAGTASAGGGTNKNPWATQQAYGLLSGRLSTEIGDVVTIGLWGKNIANKKYFTYNLDLSASLGYAVSWGNAPRTFGADVTYRF